MRPWLIPWFLVRALGDVIVANIDVAKVVVSPHLDHARPAIVAIPTDLRGGRLVLLANLITLTPGTITVEVARDASVLYVHALDAPDHDALLAGIGEFERRIRKVFGP